MNLPFLIKIEFKKSGQFIFFTKDLNSEENYDNKKLLQRPVRASGYYLQSRMDLKAHMPPLSSVAVASTLFYCTVYCIFYRSKSAGNTQLPGRDQKICQSFVGGAPCPSGRLAISIERPDY